MLAIYVVPAASVHQRDSLHEHVLPVKLALATLTVLATTASHMLLSPPLVRVCRICLVTLPILFLTCLEIRMPVFPDTLPCAGIAVLHTLQHLWVLLDIVLCPQRGDASPFPHPCFSFGICPLILYPEDFPPELFAGRKSSPL